MNDQDVKKFQVVFDCDARAVGKMRCEMDVRLTHPEKLLHKLSSFIMEAASFLVKQE